MRKVIISYAREVYYSNEIEMTEDEFFKFKETSEILKGQLSRRFDDILFDKVTEKSTEDDRDDKINITEISPC
jgi:hypothetical protein